MNWMEVSAGHKTIEEYEEFIEEQYDMLSDAESLLHDGTLILDPEYDIEIKHAIVAHLDPDNLPYDFCTIPDNRAALIEDKIAAAIAVLENYAPELLDMNPFTQRKPYNPLSKVQVEKKYRETFINKLMNLGLSQNLSRQIEKTLINL